MAGNPRRGFALMNPERQREIARKGGRAAHQRGTAHQFTSDEAREAGRKGGLVVSHDREHMVEIGRSGGKARRRHRGDGTDAVPGNDSARADGGPDSEETSGLEPEASVESGAMAPADDEDT